MKSNYFKLVILVIFFHLLYSCKEDNRLIIKSDTIVKGKVSSLKSNNENCETSTSSQIYNQKDLNDKSQFQTKILNVETESNFTSSKSNLGEVKFSNKEIVDLTKIEAPIIYTQSGERISKKALPKFFPIIKNFQKFLPSVGQSVDVSDFTTASITYKSKSNGNFQMMIYDYGENNDFLGKKYFDNIPINQMFEVKSLKINNGKSYYVWDKEKKNTTIYALVYNRFYVTIEGFNVQGINSLIDVLSKIDFESMKKLINKYKK